MLCCSCILWDERKSNGWERREEDKFRERVRAVKKLFPLTYLKDKKWFSLTSVKDQVFLFSVCNLVTVMTYVAFCSLLFGLKKKTNISDFVIITVYTITFFMWPSSKYAIKIDSLITALSLRDFTLKNLSEIC
jgi:hypothetical protein